MVLFVTEQIPTACLHRVMYVFQCYSFKSSYLLSLTVPKFCSLCLYLHSCPIDRFHQYHLSIHMYLFILSIHDRCQLPWQIDHITSWEIDGETVETVSDLIFLGSKITADGDCSHEIKRRLLLGKKIMTNLDSIFESRDITLPTKVCLVKAMVFPVVMYGFES